MSRRPLLEPRPTRRTPRTPADESTHRRASCGAGSTRTASSRSITAALQALTWQRDPSARVPYGPRRAGRLGERGLAAYLAGIRDEEALAAGETQIFSLSHVFRNRERTALHAPEFAMLEWYRVGAPLDRLMDDCARLLALAAHVASARTLRFRGREADPFEPPERVTVREAFRRHAGVSICMKASRLDRIRIEPVSRAKPRKRASVSQATTPGRTFSAES